MKRKAIVHIGTEKTGTTTLQHFLAENRAHLLQAGFYFPSSLGQENHTRLCGLAQSDTPQFPTVDNILGIVDAASRERFRTETLAAFADEMSRLPADVHTVIFSNEHLHSNLIDISDVARLKSLLDLHFDSVRIAVYLRRQVELAISLFSTRIKGGELWKSSVFPRIQEGFLPYYFDYAAILANYESVFGRPSIDVRIFQKDRLVGGDVVDDFLRLSKVPKNPGMKPVERQNVSLSYHELYVLALLNEHVPALVNGQWNRNRDLLVEIFESKPNPSNAPIVSRSLARQFSRHFDDCNEKVRADFYPGLGRLFSGDFTGYPENLELTTPALPDIIRIFGEVWNERAAIARRRQGATARPA